MFIVFVFVEATRATEFSQILINMPLDPVGVISLTQPLSQGSCLPQSGFLAVSRPPESLLPW